ncbi:MAG: hypothetical protein D6732_07045 [Methanobacteriota archaeon]|nr:MAG: hypothetical protein D6732_07045 [Euryarchaeota archaeon]
MVNRGKFFPMAEKKLENFKWNNPQFTEIIRITPEYYSKTRIPFVLRVFLATILIGVAGILAWIIYFLLSDPIARFFEKFIGTGFLSFAILFFGLISLFIFSDSVLVPNMLQALLFDKNRLIKWNCIFGVSWVKSFDLTNLDYFVKKVLIDVDEDGVDGSFVIELHYEKDEYGREKVKRLWLEKPRNKNVIEEIAKSLKEVGFEVKEPLASKFLDSLTSFSS